MRKLLIPLTLTLTVMLAGCGPKNITLWSGDGSQSAVIKVEIADTPAARTQGLMEREKLDPDTGMLFVFKNPEMMAFWMKNTKIPLEIMFFDGDGAFVNAWEMEPCTADPCAQYKSAAQAQYALEVPPKYREAHGIGVGWNLDIKGVAKISSPQ